MSQIKYSKEMELSLMLGYQYGINQVLMKLSIEDAIPMSDLFSYDFVSDIEMNITKQIRKLTNVEHEDLEHLFEADIA